MATAKPRTPTEAIEQAVKPNERRWRHNGLAVRELPGLGRRFWNATSTPLDAYRFAEVITAQQYDAGNRLRALWTRAGQEQRVTGSLERVSGGSREMSDAESEAWGRYLGSLRPLEKLYESVVRDGCCFAAPVEFSAPS